MKIMNDCLVEQIVGTVIAFYIFVCLISLVYCGNKYHHNEITTPIAVIGEIIQ